MDKAVKAVDTVFRILLASLMAMIVLSVTWQIVSRYFFGDPSSWTEELSRFLLIWVGLLGGSYAYRMKMHLGLDLLTEKLPAKAKRIHSRFVHGAVILFAVTALIGGGLRLIWLTHELQQYSAALGVSMAFVYCSLPISGAMFVFYALIAMLEDSREPVTSRGGEA